MGQTRGDIKANLQANLVELGINWYSDEDMNNSIQDAYDDLTILTQCIQQMQTINFTSDLCYYNFYDSISDYLGAIAIFNNNTNQWLRDDLSLKDFDRIRRDWEKWIGTPIFWAPSDPKRIAMAPKYKVATGNFNLYYWVSAPLLVADTDQFLIASDKTTAILQYATADLLEQAQEFNKAQTFWAQYYPNVADYADRVKRNCKADLLLRL